MRVLIAAALLVVLLAPPPPLLPSRAGPATYRQYRTTCSARYYPTTYPRICVRGWGLR